MKTMKSLLLGISILAAGMIGVQADLFYGFNTDVEGFQNVVWSAGPAGWATAPSVQQTHTAGGWQMLLTKEFAWGPGGGSANQQLEMRNLALGDWENTGDPARVSFDVTVDGTSFPPGVATWYQFIVVGNSDGANGWTQTQLIDAWHNADQADLITWHFDRSFTDFGWDAGDTWFQLYTGSNSDGAAPVNFFIDNVRLYIVPEPTSFALAGLGALALFISRRRS